MRNAGMHLRFGSILMLIAAALIAVSAGAHSASASRPDKGEKDLQLRFGKISDAVVLYDSLIVTYGVDGRISKRRHCEVMLFTDNAINRYGDPRILFNAATQDLTILAARVRMRDGRLVDTRKNGINQTTPFALDLAPDYVDWQETVVTLMGIEKGCVAELHYVIADRNPSPYLSGVEIFSAEDPTLEQVLVVKLPPRMNLKFASLQAGMPAPDTVTAGTWAWTIRITMPGRTPFAGGEWEGDYFAAVCYSTAASWQEALEPIREDISGKIGSVPPALSRAIQEAVKDCATEEDKALAVQRLAIESVRAISAPFPPLASPARDAARIYDTGYASALDGAVLLMAMLKEAGFGFAPSCVLVSAGRVPIDSVPAPELCSSIAVSVPVHGAGELLLDPSTPLEHDPAFSLAGRTLVYVEPGHERRLSSLPSRNATDSRSELALVLSPKAGGGFEGKGTATMKGAYSPYYMVREGESGLADFLKKRVSSFFGGAELVSWNPRSLERDKAEIDFTFTVNLPEKEKGERVYLAVPKPLESQLSGIERVPAGRSQCANAIRIERGILDLSCTIELPEGWRVITPPFSAIENGPGEASVSFEKQADGTQLFRRRFLFYDDRVFAVDFDKFRSLINTFGRDLIVLEKE